MKIGIITYMQSNYGAVLQAFSLQECLREKGAEVEVIDFTTSDHLKYRKLLKYRKSGHFLRDLFVFILNLIRLPQLRKRLQTTDYFKRNNYILTKRYDSQENFLASPPREDIYVSGSDQVFNLNSPYFKVYYLGFSKDGAKKVAYAPSFGVSEFTRDYYNTISSYVKDFDYLSCREESGAIFLSSITGKFVPTVVDPVLLHDSDFWLKYAVSPCFKDEYILVYDLNGGKALIDIAQKIKAKSGCKIMCITGNINRVYHVDKLIYSAGPAEFVGWFANAKYVVTDSFHGTAFSLIFSKDFYSYEAVVASSTRLRNLLNLAGCQDRLIEHNKQTDFVFSQKEPYSILGLHRMVALSNNYIDSFLKSDE